MSAAKHTPGPWKVRENPNSFHVDGARWKDSSHTSRPYKVAVVATENPDQEANARLIAAAPELLAVLETICTQLRKRECSIADCKALDDASAAIAKATGAA